MVAANPNAAPAAYNPEHLRAWTRPDCYAGAEWHGWYSAGVGTHRDADALQRANFDAVAERLARVLGLEALPEAQHNAPSFLSLDPSADPGESGFAPPPVCIVSESHWAVGWVEWIAIRADQAEALREADSIAADLEDYPVVDESKFSEYEDDECDQVWRQCFDWRERLRYLREHVYRLADRPFREVLAAVRGDWGYAACLLPCPSELLC